MAEFIEMGGYGAYVWAAYGLSALALTGLVGFVVLRGRKLRDALRKIEGGRPTDDARINGDAKGE